MSQQNQKDKELWFETNDSTSCPRCSKKEDKDETVATTVAEVDELFGWRWTPAPKKSPRNQQLIPQSHCRTCRSEQSKERRQKAREEAEKKAKEAAKESKSED